MRIDNSTLHTSVPSSVQRQHDSNRTVPASAVSDDVDDGDSHETTAISEKAYAVFGVEKESSTESADSTDQLEKMIKQLEEQIREKQVELQQVMADHSLEDQDRLQQAQAIQAELAVLQASLVYAYNSLAEAGG